MKNILITGGAGYIGSHVSKYFHEKNYNIVVLDNLSRGHREFTHWGSFYEGDISDKNLLNSLFKQYKFEAISHFAAFAYVEESVNNPELYFENNVHKASVLLNAAIENNVKVFQFSSSCTVYGKAQYTPIDEKHPCDPINPYGKSKLDFEEKLKSACKNSNMNYSILRYFNAAGADPSALIGEDHSPEPHLIPKALDVALGKNNHIEILGDKYPTPDGSCIRDFIHVNDLAKAHFLAIQHSLKNNRSEIFNLGSSRGFSVKELIKTVSELTGKNINMKISDPRPGDAPELIGSSEKIQKLLNWKADYTTLSEIIKTAWNWHRKRFA